VPEFGAINIALRRAADGTMELRRVPIPEMPEELTRVIEEQK